MSPLIQIASERIRFAERRYEAMNPNSKLQHERATSHLPGGNTRSVLHATPFPTCMASGMGNQLIDVDGNKYIDFVGDMTAGLYGHSHPVIKDAITSTMTNVGMSLGASTVAEASFAQAICDRFASIERLRFCNSGTEANLYALSVARQVTGRSKVIVFDGAYHGGVLTFARGVASNNVDKADWIIGRYNDADGVSRLIKESKDVAAVLVEGMQGAGGCIPGTAELLHAARDAAKEERIIFILDEVMTSRLASGGLQGKILHPKQRTPLSPDLTTLGKWIGGGFSIGAFGGRQDLMSVYDPRISSIHHSGTFNNNSFAMNVGYKAMTSVYTAGTCTRLNELGNELRETLQDISRGTKMVVTGVGAVMNIHFVPTSRQTINRTSVLEAGETEAALRDLLWFFLIERGFWIARRGMVSLILGTTAAEVKQFTEAVEAFLTEHQDLVACSN